MQFETNCLGCEEMRPKMRITMLMPFRVKAHLKIFKLEKFYKCHVCGESFDVYSPLNTEQALKNLRKAFNCRLKK